MFHEPLEPAQFGNGNLINERALLHDTKMERKLNSLLVEETF